MFACHACLPAWLPWCVHADLYIPAMAVWTYCVLIGIATLLRAGPAGGFKPETIYNSVRGWGARGQAGRWGHEELLLPATAVRRSAVHVTLAGCRWTSPPPLAQLLR